MKKLLGLSLTLGLILGLAPSAQAEHPRGATVYEMRVLQADLEDLDDVVRAMPATARTDDYQRRANLLRDRVVSLRDQIQRHRRDNRDGLGATDADVRSLRRDISELRSEITRTSNLGWIPGTAATLPVDTDITVSLNQGLSSRTARVEDRFTATVVESVWLDNRIVIPAGSVVHGTVVKVDRAERPARGGELNLRFDYAVLENGRRIDMRSRVSEIDEGMDKSQSGERAGYGALLGGLLGAIVGDGTKGALIGAAIGAAGGIASTRGEEIELPPGTIMTLELEQPMIVS
ncbi:MAG TPA: hypothetical protein VMR21_04210 [Vicinamibacteria bacterium]|nr:hypothetical protein [Vicinamibacteria bacterium]